MTPTRVFIGLENISLTAPQRSTLITALRALGKQTDAQPSHINHWRPRLDGDAVLIEAEFDTSELTIPALKGYLANVFGVAVGTITNVNQTVSFGLMITLAYQGTDKVRAILFGGAGATLEVSRAAAQAYLAANSAGWETP